MLETKFSEIELQINSLLSKILKNILKDPKIDLSNKDTSSLIQLFIDNYQDICIAMKWEQKNREPLNKAFSIRTIRNKYYHYSENKNINDKEEETSDILTITIFFKLFKSILGDDKNYNEFLNYLENMKNILLSHDNRINDTGIKKETGLLYVVYNESIRNSETNERLYKIGITKNSVSDRYHGLGLKMPGKFETLFAYKFENYAKAEQLIHGIFNKYRERGEWFNLNQKQLYLIRANCEEMGGRLVLDELETGMEDIEISTDNNVNKKDIYVQNNNKPINPKHPCKVFLFNIGTYTLERNDTYDATRKWWKIKEEYRNTSEYEFAVGLVKGVSIGSYKLKRWKYDQEYKKYVFDADEYPDFIGFSWHKQIEPAKGFFGYGNYLIVEFNGNGKFKILRGSKDNKGQWFNC